MAINLSQFVTGTVLNVSSVNVLFSSAVTAANSLFVLEGAFHGASGAFSTVLDNVNNAGYTNRMQSTMTSDTNVHVVIHDKLNLSSGAAASTYRVSVNYTGLANISICAMEWSGGPFAFGSTISANGTSSGPSAGNLTASSSPALRVSGAVHNSTSVFASTATGGAILIATVDPTNANQVFNVVGSTDNSSLTKNIGHSMTSSTRWLAGSVVYTAAGAGGAVAMKDPWRITMLGIQ